MSNNPIAIDASDLQYYDKQIKKYVDNKDSEVKASLLSNLNDIEAEIHEVSKKAAVNEANIKSHREELDDIEARLITLESDDKLIRDDIADLRVLVENKLDESAMEYLATKEFVKSEIANAELSGKDVDLTNYYTKSETEAIIRSAIEDIPQPDLNAYATKTELEAIQQVAGQNSVKLFAVESELFDINKKLETIPSIEGLASEQFVLDKISEIEIPEVPSKISELENDAGFISEIPSEYITESELDSKGYITEHQSLDNYATKEFVTDSIESINIPDTSEFITIADVEAKGYATEQYVLDHVNTQIETEVETQVTEVVEKQVTEVVQTQVKDEVAEQLAKNEKINYGTFGEL